MAAQPKNKITRVEQGKRRKGNTPKLLMDANVNTVPLYKRAFFKKVMALVSSTPKAEVKNADKQGENKKDKAATKATVQMNPMALAARTQSGKTAAPVKKTTRTQHKGA